MFRVISVCALTVLFAGCVASEYGSRPFFQSDQDLETHGRKSGLDRLIENDPGGANYTVASDYQQNPPHRIAVLPFVDRGNGEYVIDKIPIGLRGAESRVTWAWTHANRVRRAVTGD